MVFFCSERYGVCFAEGFYFAEFCWPPAFFPNWLQGQLLGIINKRYGLPGLCHRDCMSKMHKLRAKICAFPWGQGSACRVHVWGSFQGHQEPAVVTSLVLADGLAGRRSHTQNRAAHQPRFAVNSSLVLRLFLCGFWKNRLFFSPPSFSMQTKGRSRACLWHSLSLPDTCLTMEVSLLLRPGLLVLIPLLGSFFSMPDQNAYPAGKTSSLLCL